MSGNTPTISFADLRTNPPNTFTATLQLSGPPDSNGFYTVTSASGSDELNGQSFDITDVAAPNTDVNNNLFNPTTPPYLGNIRASEG